MSHHADMSTTTLMSTREVSTTLGLSVPSITRLVRDGHLKPAAQAPGSRGAYLFAPDEVDAYAAERAK